MAYKRISPQPIAEGGTGATSLTAHSLLVGEGTSAITALGAATNGQLPIGSTGADPVLATITAGSGITVTNGAGSITVAASGGSGISTIDGDSGSVTGSTVTLTGGTSGFTFSGSVATMTMNSTYLNFPSTTSTSSNSTINFNGTPTIFQPHSSENIVCGYGSGNFTLTGTQNVIVGGASATALTSATSNTFVGYGVGDSITSGGNNTAMGNFAFTTATTGGQNVALGDNCFANGNVTGNGTVAIGYNCAYSVSGAATKNTYIGYTTAQNITTGSYNTIIGPAAGNNYSGAETSNLLLSNQGTASENNVIRIGTQGTGNGQQNACFIAGIAGVTVASSAAVLINTSTGQLGTVSSSARFKENIQDMGAYTADLLKLRPVVFNYVKDEEKIMQRGLIAEEVEAVYPDLVLYDIEGKVMSIKYHELIPMLLNEIQRLSKRVAILEQTS